MMEKVVFDASAVLAFINKEDGYKIVEKYINRCIISAVNFSEVVTVLIRNGFQENEITTLLTDIFPEVIPFNKEQACIASSLDKITKIYGLSLGDRACLSLAKDKNLSVLTADRIWNELKLSIGIDIKLVR